MSTPVTTGFKDNAVKPGPPHAVVSSEEWLEARKKFLEKEKAYTHMRDELSRERMALPWEKVEKNYVFDGPDGKVTLADLFDGRSQLIIQHFMFGPHEKIGCVGCSFAADSINGALPHLEHHDVSLVVVSRAPLEVLQAFRKRMEWDFKWVSSGESDFNYDYHVSFRPEELEQGKVNYNYGITEGLPKHVEDLPGLSVFYKDEAGDIYHTYSTYGRGGELQLITYNYLDIAPLGRNEINAAGDLTSWVRHHDKYDAKGHVDDTGRYHEEKAPGSCCSEE
ncbi:DUF899 domain-containing protein [Chitinophaga arvensicola]|uniref:Predicted dithiol-disulfide oxidoreductase, DUF899 family n=1 Tax=Chitinophaga arvensicola TaxID=29529 RepID=A0A1I0S9M8_9BACT|nr:thioredoxin family protein [Chitinophaga arvensicola]SEW52963.1 Predicted dithiol-disulfide oxidoreductase, DUF899 family [Chitinophaga arvensicola]